MNTPPLLKTSLGTLPTDVLGRITLQTIASSSPPTIWELATLSSLLRTSRTVHGRLSLASNPGVYASILCRLFDINPVKERMGATASTTSALASELRPRIEALRAFKSVLHRTYNEKGSLNIGPEQLIRLFLMMTENDGRNLRQFIDFVDISRLPGFLCSYMSTRGSILDEISLRPHFVFIIILMWLCFERRVSSSNEDLELRTKVLNLLQPLVLLTSSHFAKTLHNPDTITSIDYFGIPCTFTLPSVIPFARLCTVDRYNVMKRTSYKYGTHGKISFSSHRFDSDWAQYLNVDSKSLPPAVRASASALETMAGLWDGAWFISCRIAPTSDVVMCTWPMRCHLREYVLLLGDISSSPLDGTVGAVERAWFPDGVIFEEHNTLLRVYDPNNSRWVQYQLRTTYLDPAEIVDIIVLGNSEPVLGTRHDEFNFHGRVRRDGQVAIIKTPVDSGRDDLGTWAFIGNVHGSMDLVGEWKAVAHEKHPSGQGWFHLAKVECVFE